MSRVNPSPNSVLNIPSSSRETTTFTNDPGNCQTRYSTASNPRVIRASNNRGQNVRRNRPSRRSPNVDSQTVTLCQPYERVKTILCRQFPHISSNEIDSAVDAGKAVTLAWLGRYEPLSTDLGQDRESTLQGFLICKSNLDTILLTG